MKFEPTTNKFDKHMLSDDRKVVRCGHCNKFVSRAKLFGQSKNSTFAWVMVPGVKYDCYHCGGTILRT